jgi:hypothetical protein
VWYAPIVILAPLGMGVLIRARNWPLLFITVVALGSYFCVNACHKTWAAGLSTGPRYLLGGMPYLMILVAAAISTAGVWRRRAFVVLMCIGALICGAATATRAEGRLPSFELTREDIGEDPLGVLVFPDLIHGRFAPRNFGNVLAHGKWEVGGDHNWVAMLPLLQFQIVMISLIVWRCRADFFGREPTAGPVET